MNKLIFLQKTNFISLVGPYETGKLQLIYNLLKSGTFQPRLDKVLFNQNSQHFYDVMQKEIESIEFLQGVNYECFD